MPLDAYLKLGMLPLIIYQFLSCVYNNIAFSKSFFNKILSLKFLACNPDFDKYQKLHLLASIFMIGYSKSLKFSAL